MDRSKLKQLITYKQARKANSKLFEKMQPPSIEDAIDLLVLVFNNQQNLERLVKEGIVKGDRGEKGRDGTDGRTPLADRDYLSIKRTKQIIDELFVKAQKQIKDGKDGKDGKDAEITPELIKHVANLAFELIELPDFRALLTQEATAIRDGLELLQGDERLTQEAIKDLPETIAELKRARTGQKGGGTNTPAVRRIVKEMDDNDEIQGQGQTGALPLTGGTMTGEAVLAYNWEYLALNGKITTETTVSGATVFTYFLNTENYYRYVTDAVDINGYPTEDSFYANFDGSNVTDLVITRS